ncbi:MAG: hypothetical protein UH241_06620 [Acutalibacteraceae bacterium]|nr:hypothetical protein [Acutalibacteraceae bacterium]
MAIVAEYHFGNTVCKIDDSCIVKTQEEFEQILKNIQKIWTDAERRKIQREILSGTDNNT